MKRIVLQKIFFQHVTARNEAVSCYKGDCFGKTTLAMTFTKRLKSPLRISSLIALLLFAAILALFPFSHASANRAASVTLKTIIIDNYAPYTFVNAQGQPDSFSVDLMKAVTQTMGVNLDIKVDTWDNARHALESGEIDFLPMMAQSAERDKLYDFSPPHTIAYDAFFTRKDSAAINSMDDLQGKTIIVMEGDQAHDYLLTLDSIKPEQLILINSLPDALRRLASGEGDAALMPKLVGLELIKDLNLTNLEPSPVIVEAYQRPFSFAVKEGNQAALERLNQGMSIVKATGEYDKIYSNWFGALEPANPFLKYLGWIILAFALVWGVLLLWSLLLRRQVAARTQSLAMEIQERKQAEEALRASEARLQVIFEHANDAIHIDNADDEIIDVNSRMCELLGYSREELLKMKIADLQAPEVRVNGSVIQAEMEKYGNSLFEGLDIHRDGRRIPVEVSVSRIESPQGDLYVSILRDITERKRMEEALRESESRLKQAHKLARIGHWHFYAAIGELRWSEDVFDIFGQNPAEFQPSVAGFDALIHPDDRQRVTALREAALSNNEDVDVEYRIIRPDGGIRHIYMHTKNIPGDRGNLISVIGTVQDITERKQMEEALRASEEKYRTVADFTYAWEAWRAPDGVHLYVSPSCERITGHTAAEFLADPNLTLKIAHPDDQAKIIEHRREAVGQDPKQAMEFDFRIVALNGETRWIGHSCMPVYGAGGDFLGRRESNYDITERKQAEEALRKSEEIYRLLIDSIPNTSILLLDKELRYLVLGGSEIEKSGFDKTQIEGKTLREAYSQEVADLFEPLFQKALRGEATAFEMPYAEHVYFQQVLPVRDGAGNIFAAMQIATNITERKQAEAALRESEERFQQVAENASEWIWEVDQNGLYIYASPGVQRILGYAPQEVINRLHFYDLFEPESREAAKQEAFAVFAQKTLFKDFINVNRHKDGTLVILSTSGVPLLDGNGNLTGYRGVDVDITERKQAESQREAALEALRESEASLQAVLHSTADGILAANRENQVLYVNERFAEMWHIPQALLDSRDDSVLLQYVLDQLVDPQSFAQKVQDLYNSSAESFDTLHFKDGRIFERLSRPMLQGGRVSGRVWSFRDISERKQTEWRLKTQYEIARILTESLTLSEATPKILQTVCEHLGWNWGELWSIDEPAAVLHCVELWHAPADRYAEFEADTRVRTFQSGEGLPGMVWANSGLPLWITDITHDRNFPRVAAAEKANLQSGFAFPIQLRNETLGVMAFFDHEIREPDDALLQMFAAMGRQIGQFIERKQTEEDLHHYLSELKVLYDNGLAISTLREPREIGGKIIETLSNNLSWHHIAIRLRRAETDDLDLIAFQQPNLDGLKAAEEERRLSTMVGKVGQGLTGWAVQTGQVIRAGDVREHPQYVDTYPGIRSGVYVPLMIGERAVGCIAVESGEENAFTDQDERLLATLGAQTAIAFENARLYQDVQWELQERLRMEEEILQLNAHLEQRVRERTQELLDAQEKLVRNEKLAVLGQMAGSVGHELRNPLGVISNAVYFLKMAQPDANAKIKEYLDMIEKQVYISDKIVGDLLDFTRIKSVDRERVSVPDLIQQTLGRFPAPENVQVELDLPADLPQAFADPQHVIQILGNFTLNACQAMKAGGRLTVSSKQLSVISNQSPALSPVEGSVGSHQSSVGGDQPLITDHRSPITDHWILITVKDTGSGISPENMKKLFEPLFTTKPKGIGLGLAVCKKLAEANGGRIEVESEAGVGSTFTLYLPIYRSAA